MATNAADISKYQFMQSDELLLDTNVWLFLYSPQKPGNAKVATYSKGFQHILAAQSQIYIDVLLVSEFINAYARMQWKVFRKNNPARGNEDFKVFRNSMDFKPIAQDIAHNVKRILNNCKRIESGFESMNIKEIVEEYALGESDFNDQVFVDLCQRRNLKLVTDDGDFKNRNVNVITANRRLLI